MRNLDKPEDDKPNGELLRSLTGDSGDSSDVNPNQPRGAEQSELKNPSDGKKEAAIIAHKATGPRTAAGKKRSKYNAEKHGLFSSAVLLKNESPAQYHSLVNGLRESIQPVGMLESLCVEELAVAYWCLKRCIRADTGEIENAAVFEALESVHTRELAAWDQSRAGQPSGGLLRDSSNSFMLREAIGVMITIRDRLARFGFQKGGDPCRLSQIYGLNRDGRAPAGIFQLFQTYSWLATEAPEEVRNIYSLDELKEQMLEAFDTEIKSLERAAEFSQELALQRGKYQSIAALIPPQNVSDRIIRRQVHWSREIDRILSRLEKLQRSRRGQPVLPSIKIEL